MKRMVFFMALLLFVAPVQAQSLEKVRFAFGSEGFLFLPYYIADEAGFFKEAGIEPELVLLKSGPLAMTALLSGDVDVMGSGIHLNIAAAEKGQKVKAFSSLVANVPSQLVVRGEIAKNAGVTQAMPLEERIKLLKGLRIAITGPGSSTDKFTRSILKFGQIDPDKDVTITPMGSSAPILAAFSQGRIDAFTYSSPTADTGIVKFGGFSLVNLGSGEFPPLKDFLYNCLTARADWLESHGDTARKINAAIAKAETMIQKDPEKAKAIASPYFEKLDSETYDQAFQQSVSSYPATPRIDPKGVEANFTFAEEMDGARPNVDPEAIYTNDYIN